MPSLDHESLLVLFRNQPELAARLLRDVLRVDIPKYTDARLASSDLTEVVPTEFRADAVVLYVASTPVFGVIVEVQLSRDPRKLFTWPAYVSVLRARHECPVELLVYSPHAEVATWAAASIHLDLAGGSIIRPRVLGPDAVPVITDLQQARNSPELAVLSAMAHGSGDVSRAVLIAKAAAAAVALISDRDTLVLYSDLVEAALSEAARKAFEMLPPGYQFRSELVRQSVEQGLQEGRQRGREEGRQQGREEGRAEGRALAVLHVLEARGVQVSEAQRGRILATCDSELLDRWIVRAVTVASADALFD